MTEEAVKPKQQGFFSRRNKTRNQNKQRALTFEEKKSYELHKIKIWLIKHLVLTGTVSFASLVILYIYVVATTKDLNYLEALMTGLGSIFSALSAIFGI